GCGSAPRTACIDGSARPCTCAGGAASTQLCVSGNYGACQCGAASTCGDSVCSGDETCLSCPGDCGPCQACSAAPSCTDALGVPSLRPHRWDPSANAASTPDLGGEPLPGAHGDCGDAQIRLRIAKVSVAKGGGSLYCIISASDGARSEVALTTKTKDLGDND